MRYPTPLIHTERLVLEPLTLDHVARGYQKNFADYRVIRHLSAAVPWPYPEDGVTLFLEHVVMPGQGETRWDWAICLKSCPDEIIGSVGIWRPGSPENRGFWLAHDHWGKGLMAEATFATTCAAFQLLDFEQLVLSNALGNERSRRVKARIGAELMGTAPASFVDPAYTEHELWRLRKDTWQEYLTRSPMSCELVPASPEHPSCKGEQE